MERRKYTREFKLEAVRLIGEHRVTVAQASRDLGVRGTVLRNWVKAFADDPAHSFPGPGRMKPEQLEIARLRREVVRLKAKRDIPKKSRGLLREGIDVRFAFIAKHRGIWPAGWLCEARVVRARHQDALFVPAFALDLVGRCPLPAVALREPPHGRASRASTSASAPMVEAGDVPSPRRSMLAGERHRRDAMLQQQRQRDAGIVQDAVHGGSDLGAVCEHLANAAVAGIEAHRDRVGMAVVHKLGGDVGPAVRKMPGLGALGEIPRIPQFLNQGTRGDTCPATRTHPA